MHEAGEGDEDRDCGEADFERADSRRWLTASEPLAKTGSRKCSNSLWPPRAAGTPTQPPMMERMARMTSGRVMIHGDSWTPWGCAAWPSSCSATMTACVPVWAWTAAPWSCRSGCSSKRDAPKKVLNQRRNM